MQSEIGTKLIFQNIYCKACLIFFHSCLAFSREGRQVRLPLIFGQS